MSDTALRRTIRRCTALLLIPLSLWPVLFVDWLHTTRGREFLRPALAFGDEAALLVLLGATVYLLGSVFAGLATTEQRHDTAAESSE
ncbi:hypothetical protein [Haloglomus halophilum]|uniref:hypothetical protein n=1 Tax=Haloglomus halophilum TaxID=2962672 RepID=UPI0020CA1B9A|nr:hypothetical protein [Haloglomus halophilum]